MKLVFAAVALATLAACGDVNVGEPKRNQGDEDDDKLEQGDDPAGEEKERPGDQAAEPEASKINQNQDTKKRPAVNVAVDVDVAVTVLGDDAGDEVEPDAEVGAPVYAPTQRAWADAVEHAPQGFRLATRAELVALIDAGAFDDLDHGGAPAVWTATVREDGKAFLVELESGRSAPSDKAVELAAVYVSEGAE